MSDRTLIAYGLIALLVAWLGLLVWWRHYKSDRQTDARARIRRREEIDAYDRAVIAKNDGGERP